ncbi:MAG: hypothetical protein O3A00_19630 [Planctomycetota bacterium]|nr:hypothetical protein [Planctomycetota bacterium]
MLIVGLVLLWATPSAAQKSVASEANAEARQAYELGKTAIAAGDGAVAVKHLAKAVAAFPKNTEYRYTLSVAYETAGKPGDAWFQIRQAVRGGPNSRKSQDRFIGYWKTLAIKGAFNVGQSKANVQKLAGQPDRVFKEAGNEQWAYAYMSVFFVKDQVHSIMDVRGMAFAKIKPVDVVQFNVDQQAWTLIQRRLSLTDARQVYIPKGQTSANWSESLVVVRFFDATKNSTTVDELLELFKKGISGSFKDAKWTVIDRKVGDLLYEWSGKDLDGGPVHTIGVIIAGRSDAHHVTHLLRGKRDSAVRDGWISFMRNVNLSKTTD